MNGQEESLEVRPLRDAAWAATVLSTGKGRVYELVRRGILPHVRLGLAGAVRREGHLSLYRDGRSGPRLQRGRRDYGFARQAGNLGLLNLLSIDSDPTRMRACQDGNVDQVVRDPALAESHYQRKLPGEIGLP